MHDTSQHRRPERKPVCIDLEELERISVLHCADNEIAAWFGVTTRTIERSRKEPEFAAAIERGMAKGRIALRHAQIKSAEGGDGIMGRWLGKQYLGQQDNSKRRPRGAKRSS
jgi:hypothetical protein